MLQSEPSRRALLVDGHHVVVDALAAAFVATQIFMRVDKVFSLAGAMDALARDADYALGVLNLQMVDSQGVEAVASLRERFPDMPATNLTQHQRQALNLLLQGMPNKVIRARNHAQAIPRARAFGLVWTNPLREEA